MTRPLLLLAGALVAAAGCASGGAGTPAAGAVPDSGAVASAASPAGPASATAGTGADAAASRQRSGANRNVLAREEIAAAGSTNLYDVVLATRPRWLQSNRSGTIPTRGPRGSSASPSVAVYVNGQLYGDASTLRTIETTTVEQVTYLTTSEAQQRYGSRVYAPAIDVRLRAGSP